MLIERISRFLLYLNIYQTKQNNCIGHFKKQQKSINLNFTGTTKTNMSPNNKIYLFVRT